MLSCCCSNSTCSWEQIRSRSRSETANGDVNNLVEEEDQSEIVADLIRMDIALLTEQYNLTKEKQKRQTLVVLFRQVSTDDAAEISGQALVNEVPVNQEMKSKHERKRSVSESENDFVGDLERAPWRKPLGIHRQTVIIPPHTNPTITSSNSSFTSLSEDFPEMSSEKVSGDSISIHSVELSTSKSSSGSRKFSAPAVLSRQLSFGGQRPPLLSSSPHHHYPFPQRKGPKKSEAARRLGMYASF
uniref:TBC1 domain-containing protein n=1 Tax=Hucho hucho TaxID=62062 RepID=A0A4W5Q9Z5_9TELE